MQVFFGYEVFGDVIVFDEDFGYLVIGFFDGLEYEIQYGFFEICFMFVLQEQVGIVFGVGLIGLVDVV